MICALLGRFMRHCINLSVAEEYRRAIYSQFEPQYMTRDEIDAFLKGGRVDWEAVAVRKRAGLTFQHTTEAV